MASASTPDPGVPVSSTRPELPDGYLDRWMERKRARRRRVGRIAGWLAVLLVLALWGLWYTFHRHWLAASALGLEGLRVDWYVDGTNWMSGGSSTVMGAGGQGFANGLSDDDLRHVLDLRNVESIQLSFCPNLTDAGLSIIRELPRLKTLELNMTPPHPTYAPSPLSDAMLETLEGQKELEILALIDVNISDRGLERFPNLPRLEILDLTGTKVTDRGIAAVVERLPSLHSLSLERTGVTREGVAALRRARPGLIITHESVEILPAWNE